MMSSRTCTEKPLSFDWKLDDTERYILLFVNQVRPPISIDDLVNLTKAPAVKILNVMEALRLQKVVSEKKSVGKGVYFLQGDRLSRYLQPFFDPSELREALKKTIDFYQHALPDGEDKTLVLAELYYKLQHGTEGAPLIKNAAEIFYRAGRNEQAANYYSHLIDNYTRNSISEDDCDNYLDSVLGKIAAEKHLLPIPEQISILTTAEKLAKKNEKWEHLSKIKLSLGQELQAAGQSRKSLRYIQDFWRLAEESRDQRMLKMATLLMSEYLHWKGKFAEVVRRYEEVLENLEEFGDDEATLKATARVGLCYVRCARIARGMGMIAAVEQKAKMLNLQKVVIFTHLLMMLSLFEIRKTNDAEKYLNKILAYPKETVGHYILAPTYICKAYLLSLKDDIDGACKYFELYLEHVHFIGWPHQNAAWNFEFLDYLESKGVVYDALNFDDEIKRVLSWDDVYMKGVAYRYRGLRNLERQQPYSKIMADLKKSETYLKKVGAKLELGRTRIALGNLSLKHGETKHSQIYLEKAWSLFSKIDKNQFPKDLLGSMPQEHKLEVMIDRMIAINESLGNARSTSDFLDRVTNIALDFSMAMRGAFYLADRQGPPKMAASRNLDPTLLKSDQSDLIKTVIDQSISENREILLHYRHGTTAIGIHRLQENGIYSLVCIPVKLGDEIQGCLYLDNRLGGMPFDENQLPFLRLVCSQTAVGLSNIKSYEEIRKSKDRFEDEAIFYKKEMGISNTTQLIIGESMGITRVLGGIRQVAPTDSAVLITGETGVGKELVAKAIHHASRRSNGPFIPVNLAALPSELVASELFGHEKGAFTGANDKHKGRFELADGGTIFLDEIGDLPAAIQVKLLRVLQEGSFERLGSAKPIRSDFRVIAATNKDLYADVEKGLFRQDLFYRLKVFPIHIPPLRARKEDVAPLTRHFIDKFSRQVGKRINRISHDELKKLTEYHWPGNVRELQHLVERAVILYDGDEIKFSGFDYASSSPGMPVQQKSLVPLAEFERQYIEQVLRAVNWKLSGPNSASAILEVKPTTLFYRMKKLGIKKPKPSTTEVADMISFQ